MSEKKDQMVRPDRHRFAVPASRETRLNKDVAYAVLALLVVVLAILIVTGTPPL
jgi:hypothetical protein